MEPDVQEPTETPVEAGQERQGDVQDAQDTAKIQEPTETPVEAAQQGDVQDTQDTAKIQEPTETPVEAGQEGQEKVQDTQDTEKIQEPTETLAEEGQEGQEKVQDTLDIEKIQEPTETPAEEGQDGQEMVRDSAEIQKPTETPAEEGQEQKIQDAQDSAELSVAEARKVQENAENQQDSGEAGPVQNTTEQGADERNNEDVPPDSLESSAAPLAEAGNEEVVPQIEPAESAVEGEVQSDVATDKAAEEQPAEVDGSTSAKPSDITDKQISQKPALPEPSKVVVVKKTKKHIIAKLRGERTPTRGFLDSDSIVLVHSFGFETMRRNNLHRLGPSTLLTAAGNAVLLIDLTNLKQEFLIGIDGGGVGAITVHPSSNYFAVGEKGTNPNVYIYAFPTLELLRVLSNGTERAFSDMRFSNDGKMLATVGSFPDYLLHIWDWEEEAVVLRAKAFSQEVYNVSFSPRFDGILYTSGTGHIRFWKMADTFTGLKLQGEIGKFGAIELSDIATYQELKDGKVVTGSECGNLLLWDGGLVKVEIRCREGTCHKGMIEMVWLFGEYIVSAGEDGEIKFWDYNQIDIAEPSDEGPFCIVEPVLSYSMRAHAGGSGDKSHTSAGNTALQVKIKTMHLDTAGQYKEWLLQDAGGALWRYPLPVTAETLGSASTAMMLTSFSKVQPLQVMEMHAGAIAGVVTSPHGAFAASAGLDGTVRLYDAASHTAVYRAVFPQGGTCIVWAPLSVDSAGTLVAVGFADGVVRLLLQCQDSWRLRHVFKPHTRAVLHLAFSPDGRHLACASQDCTIFLMAWDDEYMGDPAHFAQDTKGGWKPVGFVKCGAAVPCTSWSPDGTRLLACVGGDGWVAGRGGARGDSGGGGELVEFDAEMVIFRAAELDTSVTFEIDLPKRVYLFEPKVVAPPEPPAAGKKKEGEEEEEEQAKPEPVPPPPPGKPVTCIYVTNTTFLVGYDGEETSGVIYECTFDFKMPIKELPTHSKPICHMSLWPPWQSLSQGPCYLLTAARDGTVAIRPMLQRTTATVVDARAAGMLSTCWRMHVHSTDGFVTGVALTKDMGFLLSSADDGNLLLHTVDSSIHMTAMEKLAAEAGARHMAAMDLATAQAVRVESLPRAEEVPAAAEDITDPKHYSIQQEKIQAEEDRRMQEAEEKKRVMREKVAGLRRELEELVEWNDRLPPHEQLSGEEMELDPELREILQEEAAHKVEEARRELAWMSEKKSMALAKLHRAFLEPVAVPYMVVTALRTPYTVATFRTRKLTDDQREKMEALHARPADAAAAAAGDMSSSPARDPAAGGGPAGPSAAGGHGAAAAHHGGQGGSGGGWKGGSGEDTAGGSRAPGGPEGGVKGSVNKAEARKDQRAARQKQWAELMSRKPDDKYEDPKDVAAIKVAQNKMGDYKLKTDDDYLVPEHLRINADRKRRQILLLEESVYTMKMGFNDRLLALREVKKRVLANIAADNARIRAINLELGIQGEELWEPREGPDEWPERIWQVSDSDINPPPNYNKPGALPTAAAAAAAAAAKPAAPGGGVGSPAQALQGAAAAGGKAAVSGGGFGGSVGGDGEEGMSEVEAAEWRVRRVELEYEKERKLEKMEQTVASFDEAVRSLRRERFKLDADLKMTDLSFLVLVQELKLLKEFEKRENMLVGKLEARREEKADMVARIAECQDKLSARKGEIDKMNPRQVLAEFMQLVPETNKLHEPLLKIFKKKIKRQKKKAAKQGDEDGEDEEEEDEEEEEDMSDVDKDEEPEEEEEMCPPGCEPSLYEHVCELREKRLDQEEVVGDLSKTVEALKKDKEALVKKEKMIDTGLRQCETEIQGFQTFKQQRLNEIDVVVTLKMHQITCLIDARLPPDLSHTIVFTNQGLRQLRQRIDELKEEKEELRKDQKQLRREHVNLSKSNKAKEEHLKELEARARDVQKLKFGQEVDLELLERMSINKTAEELKEQLRALEEANLKEMKQWRKQLDSAAQELAGATKMNTDKLERVAELTGSQHRLEKELNSTQSRVVTEVGPSKDRIKAEREQLVSLVKLQAREMEALKAEINMLRRKGGHVYTPAPRPPHH